MRTGLALHMLLGIGAIVAVALFIVHTMSYSYSQTISFSHEWQSTSNGLLGRGAMVSFVDGCCRICAVDLSGSVRASSPAEQDREIKKLIRKRLETDRIGEWNLRTRSATSIARNSWRFARIQGRSSRPGANVSYVGWSRQFPNWLIWICLSSVWIVAVCWVVLWCALQQRRIDQRVSLGRCPSCGYDLTLNASGRCPECGLACASIEQRDGSRFRRPSGAE